MTTEADRLVRDYSEAADAQEQMKRDIAKNAETAQREEKEAIASIYEAAGKIKAMHFVKTQADFLNLVMLKNVKDAKEYRTRFGMSWEKFCEHVGVSRRWVDEQLTDLRPFKVEFLEAFLRFSGMPLSKIKYLAEPISGVNSGIVIEGKTITYNGETIPVDEEHAEDIRTLISNIEETHQKQIEESAVTLKTKERLLKSKEDVINKMEKEIQRLEKTVVKTDLSPEEEEAMDVLKEAQITIMDRLFDCRARFNKTDAPAMAQSSYYMLLIFIQKLTADHRQDFNELYPDAEQMPFEINEWEVPAGEIMVDRMPCSWGLGKIYKEFMDKRNPPKSKE